MDRKKKKKFDLTIFIYLTIFFALLALMFGVSRKVLFRPWTARTFAAAVQLDNRLFVFGGLDDDGNSRGEIMLIDLEEKALTRFDSLPDEIYAASAAETGGRIYIAGGMSDKRCRDVIYSFDPETEEVLPAGSLPGPRAYGSMSAFNGRLYYLGGFDGTRVRSEIIEIIPETGEASVVSSLPLQLEYHRSFSFADGILIIGGEAGDAPHSSPVWFYSPGDNSITGMSNLEIPRTRFGAAQSGEEITLVGGWGNGLRSDIVKLSFNDGTYLLRSPGELSEPFYDIELALWNGRMYLIGGAEPEYKRQIRVVDVDPDTLEWDEVILKSWVWK